MRSSDCPSGVDRELTGKGFDNYLKPPAAINKKKLEVTNEDRLFSTSSGSFVQVRPAVDPCAMGKLTRSLWLSNNLAKRHPSLLLSLDSPPHLLHLL